MSKIPTILVTGFLGAGKTTLLQHIVSTNRDKPLAYIVNEFASVDVDSRRLDLPADKLMSVAGGSIFCRCKVTDFVNVMKKLADKTDSLEGVIIEASGIADPRVFIKMLQETGLDANYKVTKIVSVVDPGSFSKLLATLPNIKHQITTADTILINKADLFDGDVLETTRRQLTELNTSAWIFKTENAKGDFDLFDDSTLPQKVADADYAKCVDPNFVKKTINKVNIENNAKLEQALGIHGSSLYRVKGFVRSEGKLFDIDWTKDTFNVTEINNVDENALVVIGNSKSAVDDFYKDLF